MYVSAICIIYIFNLRARKEIQREGQFDTIKLRTWLVHSVIDPRVMKGKADLSGM